jgi:ketosteroid isomerase-like protein
LQTTAFREVSGRVPTFSPHCRDSSDAIARAETLRALACVPKAAVSDTHRVMPEESTTPDLVELVRRSVEAGNRRDLELSLSFLAPDSVWDMSSIGMGTHEGQGAVSEFWRDWWGAYEEYSLEEEAILDLGNGVTFAVILQKGRPAGSTGYVELRYAAVGTWVDGLLVRITNYTDIDEARAAAERLAGELG